MEQSSPTSHHHTSTVDFIHKIIIIGSGPAGYSAGLYAARANLNPLLFTGPQPGGQLITTTSVENYLGLDEKNGFELTELFKNHAVKYGVKLLESKIVAIDRYNHSEYPDKLIYQMTDDKKQTYLTYSIIIATGASAKRLHLPSEEKFWNNGISACAVCDGALPMFRKKVIAVVGGGDSACEEALFLSRFASKVLLVHRGNKLRASFIMQKRVYDTPRIEVILNTKLVDVFGVDDKRLMGMKCMNVVDSTIFDLDISGLFYGIGHTPNTDFLKGSKININVDDHGYIITEKGSTLTNQPGIFACGDVQDKKYRQAITSAGSGCMSALDASEYLSTLLYSSRQKFM